MVDNEAIFADEFFNLPNDPEEAYVVYHAREARKLVEWQQNEHSGWWGERNFVDAMLAFDEVYNLRAFEFFERPPSDDTKFSDFYFQFKRIADKLSLKIKLEVARRRAANDIAIAILDANTKAAIRQLIEAIREHLNVAPITETKRRELFKRLDAFAAEVDQKLSRTEAFFDFAVQATKAFREVGAELKPITERIDRILDMVEKAQKWVEQLPPWAERKKLDQPPKRIEGPNAPNFESSTPSDDDIPF